MRVCAFLLIVTAAATAASAQSLADVARKESERRRTVQDSGKTYTNQDLKSAPQPASAAATAPADSGGASTANSSGTGSADTAGADKTDDKADSDTSRADGTAKPDETGQKDEAYWSQRMADLHERLARDETFAAALQNRIDALTTDFVNRDDPAQRTQIGDDRQKALNELERIKKEIEQDKRASPALEEEARRAGVPAGWLR